MMSAKQQLTQTTPWTDARYLPPAGQLELHYVLWPFMRTNKQTCQQNLRMPNWPFWNGLPTLLVRIRYVLTPSGSSWQYTTCWIWLMEKMLSFTAHKIKDVNILSFQNKRFGGITRLQSYLVWRQLRHNSIFCYLIPLQISLILFHCC